MTPRSILFSTILACALAQSATAQQRCAQRDLILEKLTSKYGETRQSVGLGTNNTMIEVFASVETGSWTITATNARGITCLVASGQAFEALTETLPTKGNEL